MRTLLTFAIAAGACWLAGCGPTAATLNAPYAKVFTAASVAVEPGGFADRQMHELAKGRSARIVISPAAGGASSGEKTTITVDRVEADKTRVQVTVVADDMVAGLRDIDKEHAILQRIKDFLQLNEKDPSLGATEMRPIKPRDEDNWDLVK